MVIGFPLLLLLKINSFSIWVIPWLFVFPGIIKNLTKTLQLGCLVFLFCCFILSIYLFASSFLKISSSQSFFSFGCLSRQVSTLGGPIQGFPPHPTPAPSHPNPSTTIDGWNQNDAQVRLIIGCCVSLI